jgi:hypothetical protein
MEAGSLFNQGYLGQGFNWWIGQIPDDSVWRDNVNPNKFDNKQNIKGWGRRYKVRIIGLHDRGEETIPSQQLPWAQVMYPITAGGGQGEVYQTPGIRQGNFVFGFFMDGPEGQVPIIMGILGNNTQTALEQATSLTGAKNFSPISGFSDTKEPKGEAKDDVPKSGLLAKKPIDPEVAKEEINSGDVGKPGFQPTPNQQADIVSAREDLNSLNEEWKLQGKTDEEIEQLGSNFITSVVKQGTKNRSREENSPNTPSKGNATKENSDNPHLTSAGDVGLDDKFREKIVLMKPDDIVSSSIKATQTAMDNLSVKADKFFKSQQEYGYVEAVSSKMGGDIKELEAELRKSSKEIAKYMKVPFNKMMEYTSKTINKELTAKVSALPSTMRFQFADIKDITGENALESYGAMTAGLEDQIQSIMNKMFNLNGLYDEITQRVANGGGSDYDIVTSISGPIETKIAAAYVEYARRAPTRRELNQHLASEDDINTIVQQISESNWEDDYFESSDWLDSIPLTVPKVPVCSAEDLLGRVLYSNKARIDKINDSTVNQMNGFLEDIKSQLKIVDDPETLPDNSLPEGAILSQNDEEVLNLSRGGSDYVTAENLSTYWYTNINPGITTSAGRGATVNVGVSTGGLGSLPSGAGVTDFTWVNQGTGYPNNQNGVNCSIVGSATGSGMKVNLQASGGTITNIFVHTPGTNYVPNTLMQIETGDFNARFTIDVVYGPINPGSINIVNPGSKYQSGDVLAIVGGNNDATFTVTSSNNPGQGIAEGSKGQQLSDILGLIGNLSGNVSAALNFENVKANIFPFELPPNPAVSDLYQFARGGAGQTEQEMPSFGAVGNFVDKVEEIAQDAIDKADPSILLDKIPTPEAALPFIKPSKGEPDLNFGGSNLDTVLDQLRDTAGNLIDKYGNRLDT